MLEVAFPADVLRRHFPNGKLGGMTIDGPAPGALGELVDLVVKVARPAREFNLRGQLAWARHRGSRNLKEAYGVEFLPVDDAGQRLLAFARQDLDPAATRGRPRLATDLPVRIIHRGVARKEVLADLSSGGAFVRSPIPLSVGDQVQMHVRPPGALLAIAFSARVAWVRAIGTAPGMGLEFFDEDSSLRDRLDKLLGKLNPG